jgi:hypothetical protein
VRLKFELDTRELSDALNRYKQATRKDNLTVVNRAAMNVAFRSAQFTPKVEKSKIKDELGQITAGGPTLAKMILLRNLHRAGKKIPRALDRAAERLIRARQATAGFIRAGWIPAAKKLQAFVQRGRIPPLAGRRRPGKGGAIPATSERDPWAEVINTSVSKSPTSGEALERYGGPALQRAVDFVANDMKTHAEGLMEKRARQYSA